MNIISSTIKFAVSVDASSLPNSTGTSSVTVDTILAIIFAIIGGLAFLVIVIAGLRYIAAAGDPQKTVAARNTVLYALIGLVLAVSAQAIVTFVVKQV